jgi:hypothetical protein
MSSRGIMVVLKLASGRPAVVFSASCFLDSTTCEVCQEYPMPESIREPKLAHLVYFTLKDHSPEAIQKQLAACRKYLTDDPGVVFFAAGTRTPGLEREVNDKDFHVALTVVFKNRAAHDRYQVAPQHLKFIDESKPNWAKVRVFDADVE